MEARWGTRVNGDRWKSWVQFQAGGRFVKTQSAVRGPPEK